MVQFQPVYQESNQYSSLGTGSPSCADDTVTECVLCTLHSLLVVVVVVVVVARQLFTIHSCSSDSK